MEPVKKGPDKTPEVVIISAFGRGNWLAGELARAGWRVHFCDVSEALGPWEPEDWEGPWGIFEVAELAPSQRRFLATSSVAQNSGFTLWLPQGPLELQGGLNSFHLRTFAIGEAVRAYLSAASVDAGTPAPLPDPGGKADPVRTDAGSSSAAPLWPESSVWISRFTGGMISSTSAAGRGSARQQRLQRQLRGSPFTETWLANFAHVLSDNIFCENADAIHVGSPQPLLAPYRVRQPNRAELDSGLHELEELGVRVTRRASVVDIRFNGNLLDAIEIAAERRGVERGRAFVWMLSSQETLHISESVSEQLFPRGVLEPQWCWLRYRMRLNSNSASRALPVSIACIENLYLPWTHTNFLLLKRTRTADTVGHEERLDVWIRVPTRVRGEPEYLRRCATEVEEILARRIPLSEPRCERLPIETEFAPPNLPAPRFPVFLAKDLAQLDARQARNLFYDGPERWGGLDWMNQMRQQQIVLQGLARLKLGWEAAARRAEVRP